MSSLKIASYNFPSTKKKPRPPLKVELEENLWDRKVDELSRKGLGIDAIAKASGLSYCQTSYRIHQFGNSIMAFRRGESKDAQEVIGEVNRMLRQIHGLRRKMYAKQPKGVLK